MRHRFSAVDDGQRDTLVIGASHKYINQNMKYDETKIIIKIHAKKKIIIKISINILIFLFINNMCIF